jgi:hypothetical protein
MINRNIPTGPQRVQAAVSSVNQPIACEKCGSIYFMQLPAAMFTTGANNFRNVSVTAFNVFMCICGEIQLPPGYNSGIPAGSERDLFAQSIKTAIECKKSSNLHEFAKGTVGLGEYQDLERRMEALAQRFDNFVLNGSADLAEGTYVDNASEEEQVQEQEQEQERVPVPVPVANDIALVGSGLRGRSAAAASPVSADNTHYVENTPRPFAPGGARARMARQGGGQ